MCLSVHSLKLIPISIPLNLEPKNRQCLFVDRASSSGGRKVTYGIYFKIGTNKLSSGSEIPEVRNEVSLE